MALDVALVVVATLALAFGAIWSLRRTIDAPTRWKRLDDIEAIVLVLIVVITVVLAVSGVRP